MAIFGNARLRQIRNLAGLIHVPAGNVRLRALIASAAIVEWGAVPWKLIWIKLAAALCAI